MAYVVVCAAAIVVAALTLFSGFGLGTLLMPVFALFFPIEVAVAATAVVHLANNLFKVGLVGRNADRGVFIRFAVPAAAAGVVGALLLTYVAALAPLARYTLWGQEHSVTAVGLVIALLMAGFALFELLPRFERLSFDRRYLPLGGALSGFFGGLSGHQGALRSAFLINAGLTKDAFIATGVMAAVAVDVVRLIVYGVVFIGRHWEALPPGGFSLVGAATLAAFLGSFLGARLVKKVTLQTVQRVVGVMLLVVAIALGAGLA
ncbi:MAG: TSUP family transporter [Armatimonadetes bacterium]|nr:TSUP family transporter [Armatimonadota bacterium]